MYRAVLSDDTKLVSKLLVLLHRARHIKFHAFAIARVQMSTPKSLVGVNIARSFAIERPHRIRPICFARGNVPVKDTDASRFLGQLASFLCFKQRLLDAHSIGYVDSHAADELDLTVGIRYRKFGDN